MQVTAPRFDWSFNFGHVLTVTGMMLSIGGAVWYVSGIVTTFEHRVSAIEKLSVQYVPIIQGLQRSDDRQENRLENMADAMRQQREHNAQEFRALRADFVDLNKNLAGVRESQAEIKALLKPKP